MPALRTRKNAQGKPMTDEERAALRKQYPNHWFCKVVGYGHEVLMAIPKRQEITPVPSLLGLDIEMLHGATMRIGI